MNINSLIVFFCDDGNGLKIVMWCDMLLSFASKEATELGQLEMGSPAELKD